MTCECLIQSSDTIDVDGDGESATPYELEVLVNANADNLYSNSSGGSRVVLPARYITPPRVSVHRGTNFAITTGSGGTNISFDTEFYQEDTLGVMWAIGTPTRFVAPVAGLYLIEASARFAANVTGGRYWDIDHSVDGDIASLLIGANATPGESTRASVMTIWPMLVGEYVEFRLAQTSGVTIDAQPTGLASITFTLTWLGDTRV